MIDRRTLVAGMAAAATIGVPSRAAQRAGLVDRAFLYAYGPYEFARTVQRLTAPTQPGGPSRVNRLVQRDTLADYASRNVTAPNNDTIYGSAVLDLAAGGIGLTVPDNHERYFCVAFLDQFTDNFAYIGTRATGGKGGQFWIVGPGWRGQTPEGFTLIRAPSNDVWLLARTLVSGPEDLPAARLFQRGIMLSVAPDRPFRPFVVRAVDPVTPSNLIGVVNELLGRSPVDRGQARRAVKFGEVGIRPGVADAWNQLSPEVQALWQPALTDGLARLRKQFLEQNKIVNGWAYPPSTLGNFGDDDLSRAAVALGGLAALDSREATYLTSVTDSAGEVLSGAHQYRWRLPPGGVPAAAFWSLTMYAAEPDGRFFFTRNPINRYSIGDRTAGLSLEADGSLEIIISHEPPATKASNWLPSPAGPMRLSIRAYLPKPEMLDGRWRAPPLERIN
jgi:hypothetical protein